MKSSENLRMEAVRSLEILDTPPEGDFDDLIKLAVLIFGVPISTVTIVDEHRQWFKAAVGLDVSETDRSISFCTHAIEQEEPLVVENTASDSRFANSPLVTEKPHLGFYAGVPLRTKDNLAIGTFCIMDQKSRSFSSSELEVLKILANQTMKLMELRAERIKLRESQERWQFAVEGTGDGLWDWNIITGEAVFSQYWKEMLGYQESEIDNSVDAWLSLVHPNDLKGLQAHLNEYLAQKVKTYRYEHRLRCKNGDWKWILTRGMVVSRGQNGKPKRMIGVHTDIAARKASEEVIWKQANFDMLTGLPNRRMFFDRLKQEIRRSARNKKKFALLFIDLDGFKNVNDTLGHLAGDKLLAQVSKRIAGTIRISDTLSRLSGDEFTAILTDVTSVEHAGKIANKILTQIGRPFKIGKSSASVTGSIGISIYPDDGTDDDALINFADTAMYSAKDNGKNCWFHHSRDQFS